MKKGASSLDPNAASYVPLHKSGPKSTVLSGENKGYPLNAQSHEHNSIPNSTAGSADNHGGVFASTSQGVSNDHKISKHGEEKHQMDLAFLAMNFPGISDGCIQAVYAANAYDLEDSTNMLDQLQILDETSPDTSLDYGVPLDHGSTASPATDSIAATSGLPTCASSDSPPSTHGDLPSRASPR